MRYEILHLKDFFPALGENGRDATLAAYLPDNLTEMGRDNEAHPSLLICPGGAYCFCSQREAEPTAAISSRTVNTPTRSKPRATPR